MASQIDPITGLPSNIYLPDLFQIPLNSNPALAPEWNPQGKQPSTLYPDNIPPVFATLQAQNETNPQVVQAATTDGSGNLNVNVKAGGGGGGGGTTPANYYIDGTQYLSGVPAGTQQRISGGYTNPYLYGVRWDWDFQEAGTITYPVTGYVSFFIGNASGSYLQDVGKAMVYSTANTQIERVAGSDGFMFPVPVDIYATLGLAAGVSWYPWVHNGSNNAVVPGIILYMKSL